jgi:hypothetical protein
MVLIRIGEDSVEYPDGSNTDAVKRDLLNGYGRGILKQNGMGVLDETLPSGEYQYHLTSVGKPTVMDIFIFFDYIFMYVSIYLFVYLFYFHFILFSCSSSSRLVLNGEQISLIVLITLYKLF